MHGIRSISGFPHSLPLAATRIHLLENAQSRCIARMLDALSWEYHIGLIKVLSIREGPSGADLSIDCINTYCPTCNPASHQEPVKEKAFQSGSERLASFKLPRMYKSR